MLYGLTWFSLLSPSYTGTPQGLTRLIRGFSLKERETAEQARRRFYRRIYGIFWVRTSEISSLASRCVFLVFYLPVLHFFCVHIGNLLTLRIVHVVYCPFFTL